MKILIVGSSGFIGSRLAAALETAGHAVDRAARSELDFTRIDPAAWRRRVAAHDVAINAAGLIREAGAQSFDAVHVRGPMALFDACAAEGVAVVQLSALGADEHAAGAFQRTKKSADDHLLALDVPSLVLQPSLVYGEGGASARLFTMMATLPLIPLPGEGTQQVQPVHVDDLVGAVVATVEKRAFTRERVAIVGPEPLGLRELLARLRL
ncbi:MAG TPA: NAD-dependent epimerase/dehydratase family protein, partial [Usitatibacter sp.]|nr:NAD-dependent epimerase/dehydratase family protein [Usitatibacter sp.]